MVSSTRDCTAMSDDKPLDQPSDLRLAKLEAILSTAVAAIVTIDRAGIIDSVNPATTRLFGYQPGEMIGQNVKMLMPEPFAAEHDGYLSAYLRSGIRKIIGIGREVTGRRKDGSTFPIHLAVSEFATGGEVHFAGIITDLTDRRRAEDALRASQDRLQATLDLSGIGLWRWDRRSGTTIEIDAPYASILKLPPGTRSLDTPAFLAMVHPDDRRHVAAAIEGAGKGNPYSIEYRVVLPDGSVRWLFDKGRFLDEGSSGQSPMLGATIDVTDRRRAEQALEESRGQLLQAQKLEAVGQLAGGIAHDFNNLLSVILGNQELLAMRLTGEKELELLKRAQDAAELGSRLTNRLLTFARRRQLQPTLLDLNEQVSIALELLRRSIGETMTLTTNLAPDLGLVRADAGEVENAILNIVINSRDAMPNGGTIIIETDVATIEDQDGEGKLALGSYVRLSVTDTGTGMPPEVLSRAFEPFFTTKRSGKGTGLGLSTVHGFAQQSGGAVTAYSEPGRGTTINLYLPRLDDKGAVRRAGAAGSELPMGRGETVLLVEDNAGVRDVARQRLDALGYRVIEAGSGPEAIKSLQDHGSEIRVLFSDVVMPGGMSGYELAEWAAANAPAVRILLASGYPDEVARGQATQRLSLRLLRKPYGRAELARALRQILDA